MKIDLYVYARNASIVILAFFIAHFLTINFSSPTSQSSSNETQGADPFADANEIVLIFIGSSTCSSSKESKLPDILSSALDRYRIESNKRGYRFNSVGITIENSVSDGLKYLSSFSEFDEISVGNSLSNIALQRYFWQHWDHPHNAASPQVIIAKRIYSTQKLPYGRLRQTPQIESEHIVVRKVGLIELETLLDDSIFHSL